MFFCCARMEKLCKQIYNAKSAIEVNAIVVQNYHPWTQAEFEVAFMHQQTSDFKNNVPSSLLPAVLWDVIVAYAVANMTEFIETVANSLAVTNNLVALSLVVPNLCASNVPRFVQSIVTSTNINVPSAVFLIVFCKTFGETGLKLICQSISRTAFYAHQPDTFPLRSVLLHCFFELNMISLEAASSQCADFNKLQFAKQFGTLKGFPSNAELSAS
jgi:hypothetical protein